MVQNHQFIWLVYDCFTNINRVRLPCSAMNFDWAGTQRCRLAAEAHVCFAGRRLRLLSILNSPFYGGVMDPPLYKQQSMIGYSCAFRRYMVIYIYICMYVYMYICMYGYIYMRYILV